MAPRDSARRFGADQPSPYSGVGRARVAIAERCVGADAMEAAVPKVGWGRGGYSEPEEKQSLMEDASTRADSVTKCYVTYVVQP
jgi:hypothetical protein